MLDHYTTGLQTNRHRETIFTFINFKLTLNTVTGLYLVYATTTNPLMPDNLLPEPRQLTAQLLVVL